MDVYFPAFDNQSQRALIFYVHGGGFSGGSRNERGIQTYCKKLARHGYVVSSISYRLTREGTASAFGCDCPALDKLNTFNDAVEDLQDATFFMIKYREKMGINPQKIILSGSSARAETVLNPVNTKLLTSVPNEKIALSFFIFLLSLWQKKTFHFFFKI